MSFEFSLVLKGATLAELRAALVDADLEIREATNNADVEAKTDLRQACELHAKRKPGRPPKVTPEPATPTELTAEELAGRKDAAMKLLQAVNAAKGRDRCVELLKAFKVASIGELDLAVIWDDFKTVCEKEAQTSAKADDIFG